MKNKNLYVPEYLITELLINGLEVNIKEDTKNVLGFIPVYTNKKLAKKDYPNSTIRILTIQDKNKNE